MEIEIYKSFKEKERGCDWAALVSFRGQIDRDAVTRMSSRHWTISLKNLINE